MQLTKLTFIGVAVWLTTGCDSSTFSGSAGARSHAAVATTSPAEPESDNAQTPQPGSAPKSNPKAPNAEVIAPPETFKHVPKFGLVVNDLACGMCHVSINGDVASTKDVARLTEGSASVVNGTWYGAKGIALKSQVNATGGYKENYSGEELPKQFPSFDTDKAASSANGTAVGDGVNVSGVHNGNLTLIGTRSSPIKIHGDVVVKGDLVITGAYSGVGTIYVEGNIYIPFDLVASKSVFPFPQDASAAAQRGQSLINGEVGDALGLATQGSVLIGDLGHEQPMWYPGADYTVYNHPGTPVTSKAAAINAYNVYSWYPGGEEGYRALYGDAINCITGAATQRGSFNLVEAFLYARQTIAGVSRTNTFTINGGVIADNFHVIARRDTPYHFGIQTAQACASGTHPVTGMPLGTNFVNYDYRMKAGLRILDLLDDGE